MNDDYVHGYSREEQRRLTLMQTILNDEELRHLDLAGVRSILDVGAGLGQMTRALARAAGPDTRVVGIERNDQQRAEAERQAAAEGEAGRVEFRAGDATDLPLTDEERGSFDLAHARFLLEHVRDPAAVVAGMVRAVRSGGRVVLLDDDHDLLRQWPAEPSLERAWRIYLESYRDRGHDPLVGRRMPALLRTAGCGSIRVTSVFYGATQGAPRFDGMVDNLAGVLEGAAEELDATGRLPRGEMAEALASLERWRRHPDATVWYSLPLAEGVR